MQLDWENMSIEEAQKIADRLTITFSIAAKCYGSKEVLDVSYLEVQGIYDDNLHTPASQKECGIC